MPTSFDTATFLKKWSLMMDEKYIDPVFIKTEPAVIPKFDSPPTSFYEACEVIRPDKIGTDAEVFLVDKTGSPVSAVGIVPGSKNEPMPVLEGNGYAVQRDNVMLEFNIPAASSAAEFSASIDKMLKHLSDEFAKPRGLKLVPKSSYHFNEAQLLSDEATRILDLPQVQLRDRTKGTHAGDENLDAARSPAVGE